MKVTIHWSTFIAGVLTFLVALFIYHLIVRTTK